ncbi:MAG: aldo/keto reductase [Trueperaceae bacterium]
MRRPGSTELDSSPIGLGLAALGRPGYINIGHGRDLEEGRSVSALEVRSHQVLDAAWRRGVRYFDAARSYGRAESFLGSWLRKRGISPVEVTVGSKWGYVYTADWRVEAETHEVKEHSLDLLRRQWRESKECLAEYLDLYQIHSATLDSGVLENRAVLDELARLKSSGVRIGLSASGPGQPEVIDRALDVTVAGVRLFDCVQATWNLLERSAGPALGRARSAGLGVIVKEALANGRLTSRNNDPDSGEKLSLLRRQAERLRTTVDSLALAAVLSQGWLDTVLSGATTVEQLDSNFMALEVPWDEAAEQALSPLEEPAEDYWRFRKSLNWN